VGVRRSNDPCWCGSGRKYKRCHKGSEEPVRPARVGPPREVPEHIDRPDHAATGEPADDDEPMVKDADTIERMRRAGKLAAQVRDAAVDAARPGTTNDELDALVHRLAIEAGAYPSPLNYRGFPRSVCTSVNEVICHGIPDARPLANGDIVNVDVTLYLDGVHGDTSRMALVGEVDAGSRELVEVTRECLDRGIAAVRPGRPVSDIGRAIQRHAEQRGFGVVRAFVGHGIGRRFHGPPMIPHYDTPDADTVMEPGMTFTIEPMIAMGDWRHRMWEDGWTAVTADGGRSAQFEHTLVVTDAGADILTLP
jgi:methionyl aminopeptidase